MWNQGRRRRPGWVEFSGRGHLPLRSRLRAILIANDRLQNAPIFVARFSQARWSDASISLAKNDPRYRANLVSDTISAAEPLVLQIQRHLGLFNGTYNFTGLGSNTRSPGRGKMEVTNSNVFAVFRFRAPLRNSKPASSRQRLASHTKRQRTSVDEGLFVPTNFDADGSLCTYWSRRSDFR